MIKFKQIKSSIISRSINSNIFYKLFNSVAVYGILGWGGLYNTGLDPIERLQKIIIKSIGIYEKK